MKIAVVLPPGFRFCAMEPNSIETVVRSLLSGAGDDVRVFCERGAKVRDTTRVTEIDSGPGRLLYFSRMVRALKAFSPDYIEFHQKAVSAQPVAMALRGVPNSLYRHNAVKPAKNRFDAWRLAWQFSPFDAFIFVSDAIRRDFARHYPAVTKPTYALPNPIDADLWAGEPDDKDRHIVFSGRAAPEKGLAPLCEGLAEVLERHPDWRVTLLLNRYEVHQGWTDQQLEVLAPVAAQVEVVKDQPLQAVKDALRRAAIAVVPSIWQEPFGLTALEAHAAGCAVVSSGTGGLREASGDHAVYLPEVTGDAIATALEGLISDPGRRTTLAQAGQAFVREAHAPKLRARQLDAIRARIAGITPPP